MRHIVFVLLLLPMLSLALPAFAQGQPGRPSRGSTTGGGVSATATPGVSVGPWQRCIRYPFYSGRDMTAYSNLGIYQDTGTSTQVDTTVAMTTTNAYTYTPRQAYSLAASANQVGVRRGNQLLVVMASAPWSWWFRWVNGPSGPFSSSYLAIRPHISTDAAAQVACGYLQALRSAFYVGCGSGYGAQVACVNGDDDNPTCVETGFSCGTTTAYDVTWTYAPSTASAVVRVQDLNDSKAFTYTFTSDLPATGTVLSFAYSACSGPTGTAIPISSLAFTCITTE